MVHKNSEDSLLECEFWGVNPRPGCKCHYMLSHLTNVQVSLQGFWYQVVKIEKKKMKTLFKCHKLAWGIKKKMASKLFRYSTAVRIAKNTCY